MATALKLNYSDAQLRRQLATTTRILHHEGILDYSGHISVRAPGRDALYIQAGTDPRSDVTPEKMLLVDFDGQVIEGAPGKPPVELAIHIGILKARPDVQAVIHSHLELAFLFTMMEGVQLLPMRARAVRWESGIPTHSDPSHIKLPEQGEALAKTLGPHHAALIRSHGMVLTAESLLALTKTEMEQINRHEMREFHVGKLWKYYVHKARDAGALPADWDSDA